MAVTPQMIKELRERTGVAVNKCKEALEEAKGDMELAIENLRKAGVASAVKKAGRETNEGKIGTAETKSAVALVEINTETDFVANNEKFLQFLKEVANQAATTQPANLEAFLSQKYSSDPRVTVDEKRAELIQLIGENIQIKRVHVVPKKSGHSVGVYSHLGGKIVTLVDINGSSDEESLAKDIAMHVAAASPDYLNPESIPADMIEKEKEIAKGQIQGKPANIIDKIVDGKINAFYDAVCLVRQKFIKDDELTVAQVVQQRGKQTGKDLSVAGFSRWSLGQS